MRNIIVKWKIGENKEQSLKLKQENITRCCTNEMEAYSCVLELTEDAFLQYLGWEVVNKEDIKNQIKKLYKGKKK